ncbi:3-hydroxyacyl-CoA dehydrogenase NAD-binding domain-containing protein [Neobacillus sp. MER 74]|uniref:3-hydroxyacyl-CoA dehydrogenase family protein n=1 Tax=Neobacillus sp. MER 74 TaxID=2939566 RepID=UPI002041EB78|nr:3-hydroxyacyl-CoA dehydrogenase NAD-binding domain-containing protein [Neobacillus sp. MER 74]MCM3113774.1 3-hydroxyacyl-CoA dehydrogenase NAD-binding domain-containing protein [Neobacillus sp. MER 74]
MENPRIAVIGAGLMGTGIAQVILEAGFHVSLVDVSADQLENSKGKIYSFLNRKVEKGEIDKEYVNSCIERFTTFNSFESVTDTEFVIEAVPERLELKKQIFKKLDEVINQNAIFISNTSGLSISDIASVTNRPEQVIGMHFFFPVPKMGLVEIIKGVLTSDFVYDKVKKLSEQIGKNAVDAPNYPGFLVNRVLVPMINEAIYCVMEGAKPEDVDAAMKLGANHPMGPIQLADFVGLDTLLATMQGLYEGFRDSKYRPCPLLINLVEGGQLGRKTGRGFYTYK